MCVCAFVCVCVPLTYHVKGGDETHFKVKLNILALPVNLSYCQTVELTVQNIAVYLYIEEKEGKGDQFYTLIIVWPRSQAPPLQ